MASVCMGPEFPVHDLCFCTLCGARATGGAPRGIDVELNVGTLLIEARGPRSTGLTTCRFTERQVASSANPIQRCEQVGAVFR